MLGHRLRRWPNIKPTVGQLLVFTGKRIPGSSGKYVAAVAMSPGNSVRYESDIVLNDALMHRGGSKG